MTDTVPHEPVIRPSVRVVLLDDADRLLLFSSVDDNDGRTFWYPPGGGVKEGESAQDTAARELREETGLTAFVLGPEMWRRRAVASWGGVTYDCRERFFLARTTRFEVDTSGFTESERRTIVTHRWWTLQELTETSDRLVPDDLHPRLAAVLADGPPSEPIDLNA